MGNPPQLWKTQVALGGLRAALATIDRVAATLEDGALRETFLQSAHAQQVRRRAQ